MNHDGPLKTAGAAGIGALIRAFKRRMCGPLLIYLGRTREMAWEITPRTFGFAVREIRDVPRVLPRKICHL
jgi:hypothetical protein